MFINKEFFKVCTFLNDLASECYADGQKVCTHWCLFKERCTRLFLSFLFVNTKRKFFKINDYLSE